MIQITSFSELYTVGAGQLRYVVLDRSNFGLSSNDKLLATFVNLNVDNPSAYNAAIVNYYLHLANNTSVSADIPVVIYAIYQKGV